MLGVNVYTVMKAPVTAANGPMKLAVSPSMCADMG
jgi:hypothetical protein